MAAHNSEHGCTIGEDDKLLEHFSAKWIRFAVQKCGSAKRRANSTSVEMALETSASPCPLSGYNSMGMRLLSL